jgi:hypothetical protein
MVDVAQYIMDHDTTTIILVSFDSSCLRLGDHMSIQQLIAHPLVILLDIHPVYLVTPRYLCILLYALVLLQSHSQRMSPRYIKPIHFCQLLLSSQDQVITVTYLLLNYFFFNCLPLSYSRSYLIVVLPC